MLFFAKMLPINSRPNDISGSTLARLLKCSVDLCTYLLSQRSVVALTLAIPRAPILPFHPLVPENPAPASRFRRFHILRYRPNSSYGSHFRSLLPLLGQDFSYLVILLPRKIPLHDR